MFMLMKNYIVRWLARLGKSVELKSHINYCHEVSGVEIVYLTYIIHESPTTEIKIKNIILVCNCQFLCLWNPKNEIVMHFSSPKMKPRISTQQALATGMA